MLEELTLSKRAIQLAIDFLQTPFVFVSHGIDPAGRDKSFSYMEEYDFFHGDMYHQPYPNPHHRSHSLQFQSAILKTSLPLYYIHSQIHHASLHHNLRQPWCHRCSTPRCYCQYDFPNQRVGSTGWVASYNHNDIKCQYPYLSSAVNTLPSLTYNHESDRIGTYCALGSNHSGAVDI